MTISLTFGDSYRRPRIRRRDPMTKWDAYIFFGILGFFLLVFILSSFTDKSVRYIYKNGVRRKQKYINGKWVDVYEPFEPSLKCSDRNCKMNVLIPLSEEQQIWLHENKESLIAEPPTDLPFLQPIPEDNYLKYPKLDSRGYNKRQVIYKYDKIEKLKKDCDELPDCAGFNTAGWLKYDIRSPKNFKAWTYDPNNILYCKRCEDHCCSRDELRARKRKRDAEIKERQIQKGLALGARFR